MIKAFVLRWKSYRHRFVPWIALNLQKNERWRYSWVRALLQILFTVTELSASVFPELFVRWRIDPKTSYFRTRRCSDLSCVYSLNYWNMTWRISANSLDPHIILTLMFLMNAAQWCATLWASVSSGSAALYSSRETECLWRRDARRKELL